MEYHEAITEAGRISAEYEAELMKKSNDEAQAKLEEAFPLWEEAQREIREYLGDDRLGHLCSLLQVLSDFSSE